MNLLLIAIGGALGSVARHLLSTLVMRTSGTLFPLGTFIVNLVGCVVFGAIAGAAQHRFALTPEARAFLLVGVLGGFTTFSSFGLDTFTLAHGGNSAAAFWNVVGQVCLGIGGVWLGYYLAL